MRRRGYLLAEVFVACTILAALLGLVIQMISVTAQERRVTERRAIAMEQAANLLERASAIPFAELSTESLNGVTLPDDAGQLLPESQARWTVSEESSDLPAKRIQVELTWRPTRGQPDAPIRLVTWAFPLSLPAPAAEVPSAEVPPAEVPAESSPSPMEDPS